MVWYPSLSRFTSPDTLIPGLQGVQAFNRYTYTNNNPLRYNDPSGHCFLVCALIGGVVGAIVGAAVVAVPQMIKNAQAGQPLTANIDPAEVGKAALIGGGAGAVLGGTLGLAAGALAPTAVTTATEIATAGGGAIKAVETACGGDCSDEIQTAEQAVSKAAPTVQQAIQNGLNAIQNGTGTSYSSFDAFKNAQGPAGPGMAWHHIVGQFESNINNFGNTLIQNTNNLIRLPEGTGSIHRQITGLYNSINPYITGSATLRVRDWLSTQSFEEQWLFGINTIQRLGGGPAIINKFGEY